MCCCLHAWTMGRAVLRQNPQTSIRSRLFLLAQGSRARQAKHRGQRLWWELALGVRCRTRIASGRCGMGLHLPIAHKQSDYLSEWRPIGPCKLRRQGLDTRLETREQRAALRDDDQCAPCRYREVRSKMDSVAA